MHQKLRMRLDSLSTDMLIAALFLFQGQDDDLANDILTYLRNIRLPSEQFSELFDSIQK